MASCRALLREDRSKFLALLNSMRKDYQARKDRILGTEPQKPEVPPDEGSKGVLELIAQLLKEFEERDTE